MDARLVVQHGRRLGLGSAALGFLTDARPRGEHYDVTRPEFRLF
jgi:hypothetical protein